PAGALPLALAWQRDQHVGTAGLAQAVARGRACARRGIAGPGAELDRPGLAGAAAGARPARGLSVARREARHSADPGAVATGHAGPPGGLGSMSVGIHTDGACLGNPGPGGWA